MNMKKAAEKAADRIGVYLVDLDGYRDEAERAHVIEIILQELTAAQPHERHLDITDLLAADVRRERETAPSPSCDVAALAREIVVWLNMNSVSFDSLSAWSGAKYEQGIAAILRKHLNQAPDGFVLVPREPTEAMLEAAAIFDHRMKKRHCCIGIYRTMLAAAPEKNNLHEDKEHG